MGLRPRAWNIVAGSVFDMILLKSLPAAVKQLLKACTAGGRGGASGVCSSVANSLCRKQSNEVFQKARCYHELLIAEATVISAFRNLKP